MSVGTSTCVLCGKAFDADLRQHVCAVCWGAATAKHPWTDCPAGPCGCGGVSVPIASAERVYRTADDNLACPACGNGWKGTAAQVEQAERAQAAWDLECGAEDPDGALALKAYGPRPHAPAIGQGSLFDTTETAAPAARAEVRA